YSPNSGPSPITEAQLSQVHHALRDNLGREPDAVELAAAMGLSADHGDPTRLLQEVVRRDGNGSGERVAAWRFKPASDLTEADWPPAAASHSLPVKPAQLLGLINALVIAGVLGVFYRIRRREGSVLALMLILYPITRFVLESIRADNNHDVLRGVWTHNQVTSVVMLVGGIALMWFLRKRPASAGPLWGEVTAPAGRST
ncbi:MAG: prolipoprotein diacylglyceryl transferase family protein, partial [Planctomycetota bacterium]